jgi:hypothetical protein
LRTGLLLRGRGARLPPPEHHRRGWGSRRLGLVNGDRGAGAAGGPHPRTASELMLWWQDGWWRGGSDSGRGPAALDGEEAVGTGGEGTGGAADLAAAAVGGRLLLGLKTLTAPSYIAAARAERARQAAAPVAGLGRRASLLDRHARRKGRQALTGCAGLSRPRAPRASWAGRRQRPADRQAGRGGSLLGRAMPPACSFLFLLFISFTNFQQFIFQSIDISLC